MDCSWIISNALCLCWNLSASVSGNSTHTYSIAFNNVFTILSSPRGLLSQDGYIYWATSNETLTGMKLMLVGNNNHSIGTSHNIIVIGV